MAGVNKAILVGNLGSDPEMRYTPGGTAVANFNIATSEVRKNKEGVKETKTEWHRIVAFSRLAEICGEYLSKGKADIRRGENSEPHLGRPRRQQAQHNRDSDKHDADARC